MIPALLILIMVIAFVGTCVVAQPLGWWFFIWVQERLGNDEAVAWAKRERRL